MTMIWIFAIGKILLGVALLAWGADRFITACVSLAKNFGMPPLLIGMLMVGFATSFPEIVVAAIAAWHGTPGLAIGNAIGSNIANVGLVVGATALVSPLVLHSSLVKREFPIQIIIAILVGLLLLNGYLTRIDGLLLIAILILHMAYWVLFIMPNKKAIADDDIVKEIEAEMPKKTMPTGVALTWWLIGLVLLFVSSELLVGGASSIAKLMGVSDLVIGLTIVAVGTSLPELAASVVSALRNEPDIALGNIVGSNIFNLLAVLAMPALIAPSRLAPIFLQRDYPIMIGFMLLLWLFAFIRPGKGKIGRGKSAIFLGCYMGYILLLVFTAKL